MRIQVALAEAGLNDDVSDLRAKMRTSAGKPSVIVEVGTSELLLIANDLEWDGTTALAAIARYSAGEVLGDAKGPVEVIGPFNETLCYLLLRSKGWDVERVETYKKGDDTQEDYPQPDFLVLNPASGIEIVECKATEAFSFKHLSGLATTAKPHVCNELSKLRYEAFEQLGYTKDYVRVVYSHKLKTRKRLVPFPLKKSWAFTTAFVDGRVDRLSIAYKAPSDCSGTTNCITCARMQPSESRRTGFAVLWSNSPGAVWGLDGSAELHRSFFLAYRAWRRAGWSRNPAAYREAAFLLRGSVLDAVGPLGPGGQRLAGFYSRLVDGTDSYLKISTPARSELPPQSPVGDGLFHSVVENYYAALELKGSMGELRLLPKGPARSPSAVDAADAAALALGAFWAATVGPEATGARRVFREYLSERVVELGYRVDERFIRLGWEVASESVPLQSRLDFVVRVHGSSGVPFTSAAFRWVAASRWRVLIHEDGRVHLKVETTLDGPA